MSSELDDVVDREVEVLGLIKYIEKPYTPPELEDSADPLQRKGLTRPTVRQFDLERHVADLERLFGRWFPLLLALLMVLTFASITFGPTGARDVAVQVAALFLSVIAGILGYVFGRQSRSK